MIDQPETGINAPAWCIWFLGVAAVPLVSRNPLYLALLVLIVVAVQVAISAGQRTRSPWRLFAYIGTISALFSVGFNVLTVHTGDREFASLPDQIPIIGGTLTVNALVYGLSSALAITILLFAAAALHSNVRHADLVRMLPATFGRLGVAAGVALGFVPQAIAAGREVYDAQRARGARLRGVRDATAFLMPVVSISLERALTMSEALEVRGFGASATSQRARSQAATLPIVLIVTVAALILLAIGYAAIAAALIILSVLALIVLKTPQRPITRLRPVRWNWPSRLVAASALPPVVVVLYYLVNDEILRFEPFPVLNAPGFSPFIACALLTLLVPAFSRPSSHEH